MRPPYSVLARRMGPGGAGAPRGARDVTNPNPNPAQFCPRRECVAVVVRSSKLPAALQAWIEHADCYPSTLETRTIYGPHEERPVDSSSTDDALSRAEGRIPRGRSRWTSTWDSYHVPLRSRVILGGD